MSKAIGAGLKTHFGQGVTTIALCWRVVRTDAAEFYFTSHDSDLTIDGNTYEASSGALPRSIDQTAGMAVDNLDVLAFLESDKIVEAALQAGLFDYARVDIFAVNYADLTQGKLYLAQGWTFGEVTIHDNHFVVELRGLQEHLAQRTQPLYSLTCRAELGDSDCGIELGGTLYPNYSGAVTSVTEAQRKFIDTSLASSAGSDTIYRWGTLTWSEPTSGDSYNGLNANLQMEVQQFDPATGEITLLESMPYTISAGDEFTLTYGCDKALTTCAQRFNNTDNFRGEPYVPGNDRTGAQTNIAEFIYRNYPNPFN